MTAACPNCDKPVRTGAKFCGHCGASISVAIAKSKAAPDMSRQQDLCPNCKKPISPSAKFCRSCGFAISQGLPSIQKIKPEKEVFASSASPNEPEPSHPEQQLSINDKSSQMSKKRSTTILIAIGSILVVCALASLVILLMNRGWLQSLLSGPRPSSEPTTIVTQTRIPPSSLATTPIPIATTTPTITVTNTFIPNDTATPTNVTRAPEVNIPNPSLFSEGFDADWQNRWFLWGTSQPTVSGENPAFQLNGVSGNMSGITSKFAAQLSPGMLISFEVRVDTTQLVLFDWDTLLRQPDSGAGIIHLEVGNSQVKFQVTRAGSATVACPNFMILDNNIHLYQIVISQESTPSLIVDGQEKCSLPDQIALDKNQGHLSFSGRGAVDNIYLFNK